MTILERDAIEIEVPTQNDRTQTVFVSFEVVGSDVEEAEESMEYLRTGIQEVIEELASEVESARGRRVKEP